MTTYNKERQVKEILKCGRDVQYFLNKYARIQHPVRGLIPFDTYSFQDDVLQALLDNRLNVILKARQLGLSTVIAGFAVWLAIFHKHQNIIVIATKQKTAMNFLKKCKVIVKNLPKWMLLQQIAGESKQHIEFSQGSQIQAIPTSEDAGRSEGVSLLVCDEFAWMRNAEELWVGLQPVVSTGGRVAVLSTPHGVGDQFHKLYTDAESGVNNFNPICLPWDVHPDHDEEWFENETKGMSDKQKAQEYMTEFMASGDTFLTMEDIKWVGEQITLPIDKWAADRSLWVWQYPQSGHKYLISADVSRGDSHDFSAFHVIDMDEADIVAEYKGKMPPDDLGRLMAETGEKYNTALLCPESNTFGYTTLTTLRDIGYKRVYREDSKAVYIVEYSPIGDDIGKMGFATKGSNRPKILAKMEEIIRNKLLGIHSSRLYNELKTFVWTGRKAEAMKGHHDDLVMALAIGTWIYDVGDGVNVHDRTIANALLDGMSISSNEFKDVPGSGHDLRSEWNPWDAHAKRAVPIKAESESDSLGRDPRFNHGDFSWLLS